MPLQATAAQQRLQCRAHIAVALHRGRLPAPHQRQIESQLQAGLARQLVQRTAQRLGSDVKRHGLRWRLGPGGLQRHGQTQADGGPGQWMETEMGKKRMHASRP